MATREGGRFCQVDADCSKEQYCYEVSGLCVDHTQCKRYNRQESVQFSRHPSQCGPCLPGYSSEILGTGEMRLLCQKSNSYEPAAEPAYLNSVLIIWMTIAALLVCLMAMVLGIHLKRRSTALKRSDSSRKQWNDFCEDGPSAPPAESTTCFTGPFIGCEDRLAISPFNNNKNLKDKNNLVSATPCKEPNWIRTDPNYELNLSNDNLNVSEQSNTVAQLPPAESDSNNWAPEQLTIEVANGTLTEQVDNTINAVLVQRSNPSGSGSPESNTNEGNSSTSGSNSSDNRERVHGPNIVISQKISMNVNVLNGDC